MQKAVNHVLVVNRNKVQRAILAIDVRNKLAHLAFELRRVRQRGGRDLNEDDVADPLRVVLEQLLKHAQLLDDALDHVEFVPPDDDLLAPVQRTDGFQLRLDARTEPARYWSGRVR